MLAARYLIPFLFLLGCSHRDLFRDASFESALTTAKAENKIVLVDFFTTWCGPCKLLDTTTWKDTRVLSWVDKKCVALKLDAEQHVDLAKRYAIGAYPTVLLLKSDGTEIDRLVGYKDAATFLAEADAALAGKDSVTRAKDKLAGQNSDAMARKAYGAALAQKGRHQEALAEYLWCFDNGRDSPGFGGVRLSFLLSDIARLGEDHPPAIKALEERRDAAEARLIGGEVSFEDLADTIALNRTLKEPVRSVGLYEKLKLEKPLSGPMKSTLAYELLPILCEARRYEQMLELVGDPERYVTEQIERFAPTNTNLDEATRKKVHDLMQPAILSQGCLLHEALVARDRKDSAARVAEKLIVSAPTGATYAGLIRSAARAGAPEVAAALTERGLASVPKDEQELVRRATEDGKK